MRIIGLTGSIGMGKSTLAALCRCARVPVFDADRVVHGLQARHGLALPAIAAAFPGTVQNGVLNRPLLRQQVIADDAAMRRLEAILHPLVRDAERRFVQRARRMGARLVVLDIPLLLETGGAGRVDLVLLATAPAPVQMARVLARRTVNRTQALALIARQMPDRLKRQQADVLIHTGLCRFQARRQLLKVLHCLRSHADEPIRAVRHRNHRAGPQARRPHH